MMFKILILITIFGGAKLTHLFNTGINDNLNVEWENFKSKFHKNYGSPMTELTRRLIWEENMRNIQIHNIEYDLGKKHFQIGINHFSDLTPEEFRSRYLGYKRGKNEIRKSEIIFRPPLNLEKIPSSIDWRKKGFVTPVKNQMGCGSCWAFSTTGSLEGQHYRATGKLVSLSEQQLVDCSRVNNGCEGGIMDEAFKYVRTHGIERESVYPYTGNDDRCHYEKNLTIVSCKGYVDIETGKENDLEKAVSSVGPISVGIDASQVSFQNYKSGVYDEPACSSKDLDHGVLVVGYGEENGKKYWLVKNSWGPAWGLGGYIKMSRGKNNQCGIATMASYPLV